MSCLSIFQPPPPVGYVTVCEQNGELLSMPAKDVQLPSHLQSLHYPDVDVYHDLRPTIAKETARSAFLEHDDTWRQRLLRAWYEHGLTGVLEELASNSEKGKSWICSISCKVLAAVRWANALHGSLFPHLAMSSEDLTAEYSANANWSEGPIRYFAWHPHTTKFALALRDDSVRVYTARKQDIVPCLKHKLQKGVACLGWKPISASVLAVACQSCVLIWHVDPTSLATRPSTSSVQVLRQPGHMPVTCLAWCPTGGVLVTASPTDSAMMVWDVAMEKCVPLRRVGGGGVSLLSWSPEGSKLFAGCPSPIFRVWESQTWTCEKWTKLINRCQVACWSPDGTILLFANAEEPIIYSLTFPKASDSSKPVIGGSKLAVSSVDLSEVMMESDDGGVRVGGTVQAMSWDPTGERLAVQFKGGSPELIALFQTRIHPVLEVIPCGFVRGDPNDVPLLITFQPKFEDGALLTVAWSSGKLSYIPLFFISRSMVEQNRFLHQQTTLNGHVNQTQMFSVQD